MNRNYGFFLMSAWRIVRWVNCILFGSKRDEVTRAWRKLHNEELNDLYSSPIIVRVIKSRRINGRGM
jgi:hypothetical protein